METENSNQKVESTAAAHAQNIPSTQEIQATAPGQYRVIRRNGKVTSYDRYKIKIAITKAFLAVEGGEAAASGRIHETVEIISSQFERALTRNIPDGGTFHIENVQDQVELALMREGHHKVARDYVLYRERRAQERASKNADSTNESIKEVSGLQVTGLDGARKTLDSARMQSVVSDACSNLNAVDATPIITETLRNLYEGVPEVEVATALTMSARTLIEKEPNYSYVAARLLLDSMRREALSFLAERPAEATQEEMSESYGQYFKTYIQKAADLELVDMRLANEYDLDKLTAALLPERDYQFTYLGLQTLYDRYFLHSDDVRFELPQAFFMRVAMGLAINEVEREDSTIEFYRLLSSFDFMSSTPTLFNSGTLRQQLSSCYLTTVPDDLYCIFDAIKDDVMLSKFAGGLGNDWTPVRSMGSHIKGTNGKSQGIVPFLKVANYTAVAVNQGGKRKGAMCAYLETWHLDVEEFIDLRKNTGDDRRRTHDMNTANWIPDLFMKRVSEEGNWTLFSPDD